jgi:hypothetical protein
MYFKLQGRLCYTCRISASRLFWGAKIVVFFARQVIEAPHPKKKKLFRTFYHLVILKINDNQLLKEIYAYAINFYFFVVVRIGFQSYSLSTNHIFCMDGSANVYALV